VHHETQCVVEMMIVSIHPVMRIAAARKAQSFQKRSHGHSTIRRE
jgi:hypothetical protein